MRGFAATLTKLRRSTYTKKVLCTNEFKVYYLAYFHGMKDRWMETIFLDRLWH